MIIKMKKELKQLIKRYKEEIETLKANTSFNDNSKIQAVAVFREIIEDLEKLLKANNA